mgnify:FL=1
MATVTAALTLSSSDLLSDALSTAVSVGITADITNGMQRKLVTSTAQGTASGQVTLIGASTDQFATTPAYLYVKNTDTTRTNYVYVYQDSSDNKTVLKLAGGDWAFLPVPHNVDDLKAFSTAGTEVVEFMAFGSSS